MVDVNEVFGSVAAVERATTSEQVADGLRELILSGQLKPNTPLKETQIAEAFKTSRTTVRETLLLLTQEGIVQRTRHRGAVVAVLDPDAVRDMCHIRKVLEMSAVDACVDAENVSYAGLVSALDNLAAAVEDQDWHNIPLADAMFHRALVALHHSPRVMTIYDQLLSEIRLATLVAGHHDETEGGSLVDEHRQIYELLVAGEYDKCRNEIARIIDETQQRLLDGFAH